MEFPTKSLEELSPHELIQLAVYGLRACRTQDDRDRLAKAVIDVTDEQINTAVLKDNLWNEFDYLGAREFITNHFEKNLYSSESSATDEQ